MFLKIVSFLRRAAVEGKGAVCPKCGSTNTDKQNGIWRCYECDHEW
jgi:ribosomal protein L37AE/L43A